MPLARQQPFDQDDPSPRKYNEILVEKDPYDQILERVRRKVEEAHGDARQRRQKAVYGDDRVRIDKGDWSRKMKGTTDFSLRELLRLAVFFDAPPGWPFIDWEYARSLKLADAVVQFADRVAEPSPPYRAGPHAPESRPRTKGRK